LELLYAHIIVCPVLNANPVSTTRFCVPVPIVRDVVEKVVYLSPA
jgi:hypothetical protein